MTDTPLSPREIDEALAAEYVLGVLTLTERRQAEARIKADPAFAALVVDWEGRLAGLNDGFAEAPAPKLLPAIEARLFPAPARRRGGMLRWLSGAATAAMVVLLGLALLMPLSNTLVAVLTTPDARLTYEVRHSGSDLQVQRLSGLAAAEGRVHELWLIAPGAAPVSLGLLTEAELTIPYPRPPEGWTLAVSIEPEGGSASGTPTGPVILTAVIGDGA